MRIRIGEFFNGWVKDGCSKIKPIVNLHINLMVSKRKGEKIKNKNKIYPPRTNRLSKLHLGRKALHFLRLKLPWL